MKNGSQGKMGHGDGTVYVTLAPASDSPVAYCRESSEICSAKKIRKKINFSNSRLIFRSILLRIFV